MRRLCTHSAIETALACRLVNGIKPWDIAEMHVGMNTPTYKQVCELLDVKFRPYTPTDGQFRIPYTVATALATGGLGIGGFTNEAIRRPDILRLMARAVVVVDADIEAKGPGGVPCAEVRIRTGDGQRAAKRIDFVKGIPQNPFTFDNWLDKFRKCIPHSARRIPQRTVEALIDMVRHLEEVDDVSSLCAMLTVP